MSTLVTGPWLGRVFRLHHPLAAGTDLRVRADSMAWSEESSCRAGREGKVLARWWCSGRSPHDGAIAADPSDLSYSDGGGSRVWRLWVREEARAAPKFQVTVLAERYAQVSYGTPLELQRARVREDLLERARREVLAEVTPKVRIVDLVMMDGWVWVGRTSAAEDTAWRAHLYTLLGKADPLPLAWSSEGEFGWGSLSLAAVHACLAREDAALETGILLTEVSTRGKSIRFRSQDPGVHHRDLLKSLMDLPSPPTISQLIFEVAHGGGTTEIALDEQGVCRFSPSRSPGGMPADRLRRRFEDGLLAAERVGRALRNAVDALRSR